MKIRKEVKVGLFALLTIAVLYLMLNYFKGKDLIGRNVTYYAMYDDVTGLQVSSPVDIRGMKVGVVTAVTLDDKSGLIKVAMQVDKHYRIPVDSRAKLYSSNLMGSKAIELEMGKSADLLHKNGTMQSYVEADVLGEIGGKVGSLADDLHNTLSKVNDAVDNINSIIEQNSEGIHGAVNNIDGITANINTLLKDKSEQIKNIVDGLNALSDNLQKNSEEINSIIANASTVTDSLRSADLKGVINNLSSAVGELHTTLAAVNNGQGSVGKAINNPDLYNSLVDAVDNLSTLLTDLKRNPKKYINVTVFGRKEKTEVKSK